MSYAVDVRTPAAERDRVAAWLVGHTGQAVEEREDGILVSVTDDPGAARGLLRELTRRFGARVSAAARTLPAVDWQTGWKAGLGPRRVGRLLLTPTWSAEGGDGPTVRLDPESAFGSGEHGSTRSALALLDRVIRPGDRVLDLGSGSGILAIAAARLGAARVIGVELDAEAEPIASRNAERNGVADRVCFVYGDAAVLAPLLGPAELIVANILRSQNEALLGPIRATLVPRGAAVFAGMETTERGLFLPALEAAGFAVRDETTDAGWWAVTALPV